MSFLSKQSHQSTTLKRMHIVYVFFILFVLVAIGRLFYLQIIKHDYYKSQANASQFRSYEIPAERGQILFENNGELLPLVLNERTYTVVSDPLIISDKDATATKLSEILGKDKGEIYDALDDDTVRYQVLARGVNADIKDAVELAMREGEIEATFAEATSKRVYPYETLASTTLGFVDDEREGRYGLEQALNEELSGTPGRVKALTDQNGIPLLASGDNVSVEPIDGQDIVTTLDPTMQKQVELLLEKGVKNANSDFGDVVVLEANTGKIRAMASYPSYDPSKFREVEDTYQFINSAVARPLEPGSVIKTLTVAAALEEGVVYDGQTYFDPSFYVVDGYTIRNVEEDGGAATRSIEDILSFSLNTGATWLLMQMGGGELNERGRLVWEDYMDNKYMFGQTTGVEQGFEETGITPDARNGDALNLRYANSSFGQGMTVTPLQMASALATAVNGGTYYQPTLVEGYVSSDGEYTQKQPEVKLDGIFSEDTSNTLVQYMITTLSNNSYTRPALRDGYKIGGKTGTAEVANPAGGYYTDRYNGTYVGFVGFDKPEYIIMTRVNEPNIGGYAGTTAASPIFVDVAKLLTDELSAVDGE